MMNEWVIEALDHAKMSQAELARLLKERLKRSFDRSTVNKMTIGTRKVKADELIAIEELTGYPAPNAEKGAIVAPNAVRAADTAPLPSGGARDVPVYGVAFGGRGTEADFSTNGEVLEYTARPALLVGRRRAFAVNVINDSMSPLYTSGKKVFVDPDGMRPKIGDVVLVELYADDPDAAGPGYIKTLVARGGAKLVLSQFNPPKELSFAADRVKTILRVIPYDELLGI